SDNFKNGLEQVETSERKQVNLKPIKNSSPSQSIEFMEIDEFENSDQKLAELESDEFEELDRLETSERDRILGSELENIDPAEFPLLTQPVELIIGSCFSFWAIAKHYIKEYGRQRGFAINRYRVGYHKNSDSSKQIGSKKINCKWYINLSKPENSSSVHITFIHLEHNHELLADNARFAMKFRKFDQPVLEEIERAVDLSNAIQKIKRKNQITGSDASQLLKFLLNQQKEEPTIHIFTASMQSTQRVESINVIIHKAVSSSSTMFDVAKVLDARMQKEDMNKEFLTWKYKSVTHYQPFIVESFFSDINKIIKKYFSTRIITEIQKQMCESVIYRCEKLSIEEAFKDQSNQDESYESQIQANSHEDIEHIEDYYNYQQTYLKALLNSVTKNSVKELQDEAWACIDSIFNEQFIGTSTKHLKQANYTTLHQPKALNYSLEDNDQGNLDDIILAYISEKKAKLNAKMQSERNILTENMNLNNEIKLPKRQIYNIDDINNPLKCQGRGRPAGKWLKAYNKKIDNSKVQRKNTEVTLAVNENRNNGKRKCRLCHKTGHYAPKCPSKENC
ncbi:5848_t:CDS:10, partial [Gigaspora margarita]